ncbi:type 4 pilus major pilin [Achromobacter insuavis]|uniref:type 4 pilus major pilin n=1 Tax=Achromobacter insuavis TaxID=1287735 RepID=UPI001F13E6E9|nr:type 4 pilus major pilin [Achromobacter insuavis]
MTPNISTISSPKRAQGLALEPLRKQRGDQLVTYLLAGALIAMALAYAFSKYFVESNASKIEGEVSNIVTLWKSVSTLRDVDGFASVNTAKLQAAKAIPAAMSGARSGTLMHKWNGTVTITGTESDFAIRYQDVPADACLAMRPKLALLDAFYSISDCATTGTTTMVMSAR